eukprot:351900-Chlamydomonas_euryale.AAC.1
MCAHTCFGQPHGQRLHGEAWRKLCIAHACVADRSGAHEQKRKQQASWCFAQGPRHKHGPSGLAVNAGGERAAVGVHAGVSLAVAVVCRQGCALVGGGRVLTPRCACADQ